MKARSTPEVDELVDFIYETTGALFHETDEQNFPLIERYGLLSKGELERVGMTVWNPGGNDLTRDLDHIHGLWKYVFAAFRPGGLMPKHGNHRRRRPRVLLLDPKLLRLPDVKIALGRANHQGTKVYGVKWAVKMMPHEHFARYLQGTHDWQDAAAAGHYSRISNYEILIPNRLEPRYIMGYL